MKFSRGIAGNAIELMTSAAAGASAFFILYLNGGFL
jgi:hypothetical protein